MLISGMLFLDSSRRLHRRARLLTCLGAVTITGISCRGEPPSAETGASASEGLSSTTGTSTSEGDLAETSTVSSGGTETGQASTTSDTMAPTAPTELKASEIASTSVSLGWIASVDQEGVTEEVDVYRLYRCAGTGCEPTHFVDLMGGTTYEDYDILSGRTYRYRVTALDAEKNESPPSNLLEVVAPIESVEINTLESGVAAYATFQSHNQKIVTTENGLFLTYIDKQDYGVEVQPGVFEDQMAWRLLKSTNNGDSFEQVFEATHATMVPVLEVDSEGYIYLMHSNWNEADKPSYLWKFHSGQDFANATQIARLPSGAAEKNNMLLDEDRGLLYYFEKYDELRVLDMDGGMNRNVWLTQGGDVGILAYPHLAVDEGGTLYAAWTAQNSEIYQYRSIHCVKSFDQGISWQTLEGTPLATPIISDETGPATEITVASEHDDHTWLASFSSREGKLHFAYQRSTLDDVFISQNYVRVDAEEGSVDVRTTKMQGDSLEIKSLDGHFVDRPEELFFVSRSSDNRIAIIGSRENGLDWHDVAASLPLPGAPYAISGQRETDEDSPIVGAFRSVSSELQFFKFSRPELPEVEPRVTPRSISSR